MNITVLPSNLARVRDEIASVQGREGRTQDVRILAVTKGYPPAAVQAAISGGIAWVGENRVQEALAKQDELGPVSCAWHLIGHLQTNKARFVPRRFAMVHSVDSLRVVRALGEAVERVDAPALPILIQVNVSGETQKSGSPMAEAEDLVGSAAEIPGLQLRGLMTMAPLTDDEGHQRRVFAELSRLRDRIATSGPALPELSMGMSGDYRAAVAEGATIVRLGTALFGERTR